MTPTRLQTALAAGLLLCLPHCRGSRSTQDPLESARSASPADASSPTASAPASPREENVFLWTRAGTKQRTRWLTLGPPGPKLRGVADEVFAIAGDAVWRYAPRRWDIVSECQPGSIHPFETDRTVNGTFSGAQATRVAPAPPSTLDLVAPPPQPLQCETLEGSSVELLGSAGPLLFVRAKKQSYFGGGWALTQPSFALWDLEAGRQVDWIKEVTVSPRARAAVVERVVARLFGDSRETNDHKPPAAEIAPAYLQPAYEPDLVIRVCFEITSSNDPAFGAWSSHGPVWADDCEVVPLPERFARWAVLPAGARALVPTGDTLAGWSNVSGAPLPPAATAAFHAP
jgi:hypothetical protein